MPVSSAKHKHGHEIVGLLLSAVGLLVLLSLASFSGDDPSFSTSGAGGDIRNAIGIIGAYLADALFRIFGMPAYLFPLFFFAYAAFLFLGKKATHPYLKVLGAFILLVSAPAWFGLQGVAVSLFGEHLPSGGVLGYAVSRLLLKGFSITGSYIITGTAIAIALMLLTPLSPSLLLAALRRWYARLRVQIDILINLYRARAKKAKEGRQRPAVPRQQPKIIEAQKKAARDAKPAVPAPSQASFAFTGNAGAYRLPSPDLLGPLPPTVKKVSNEDMLAQSELLARKLLDFDIQGRVTQVYPGPIVTMFEFELAPGVKVSKIVSLADDLALAMKASSVRIVAPLPGKGTVGIEVPNNTRETVYFRQMLDAPEFQSNRSKLRVPLGKDIFGGSVVHSIDKMPHLLVAGATGSGKSVAINTIILSILFNAKPHEVKLVLIDPKMLELSVYDGILHLLSPVVTQPKRSAETLRALVAEMERRYRLLAGKGSKHIESYNKLVTEPERLPYIVVIIDELADLMLTVQREIEDSIMRIAQMARAAGIHLIVATQRPSVDVITGLIKANLPARISFQVSSKTDSRTILDTNGAENLLGMGDMLFLPPGTSHPVRVHGCFVSEGEIKRVVEFVKKQGNPNYALLQQRVKEVAEAEVASGEESERDALYERAVELVTMNGQASTSFIQRRLRVGYNRAARMIEMMEEDGVIAPADGAKPREVLVRKNMDGSVRDL
ncbi:MAG TPA: cell division protein FtsK [Nitrospiraceae bacterium]|nr:cell division protein FtsK [Nitrospiraceae bacterium]